MTTHFKAVGSWLGFHRLERTVEGMADKVSRMNQAYSRIDSDLSSLDRSTSTLQGRICNIQGAVTSIEQRLQDVAAGVEQCSSSVSSSAVALQQQMNEAIGQISKGKFARCRFRVETREGNVTVTQYEFVAKEHWFIKSCKAIWGVLPVIFLISLAVLCWVAVCKTKGN